MRLSHNRPIRPFALSATAALIAATVALAFGAGVGLAADYQDANHNVCEGTFSPGSCEWGTHITGARNIALGDQMMPALGSGRANAALDFGALEHDTTGSLNIASGVEALRNNTTGSGNVASGVEALRNNTIGEGNLAIGTHALLGNTTGRFNAASGYSALESNTTGSDNTADGRFALGNNTTGNSNVASGTGALLFNITGSDNVASGADALESNTTGFGNTAYGEAALIETHDGSSNVAIGRRAGAVLESGSNNIYIANEGVAAEQGATRIGTEDIQTRAFVAGVYKKPITTPACAVRVNSKGQLGCNQHENSAAIATFASFGGVRSGKCLSNTELAGQGHGTCPAKTTGFLASSLMAGPTPAGGATVSNLYADTNAMVTGSDTVLVAVIDNTTGATLLSCTVNSTTKNYCSNPSGSGSTAAGDNIEVEVTATPSDGSGNNKSWRVRFRY